MGSRVESSNIRNINSIVFSYHLTLSLVTVPPAKSSTLKSEVAPASVPLLHLDQAPQCLELQPPLLMIELIWWETPPVGEPLPPLMFNFTTAAYDACNTANPISTVSNRPSRITRNRTGDRYFICGVPGHCSACQKLKDSKWNSELATVPHLEAGTSSPPVANSASSLVATSFVLFGI
ncbi:hypothetical protein V6N13_136237 [Hibiscus sabdariffa]|uniref:Phytocyanin domain-containing protein n=1 Tax=Hibiscus sabdariffa TaxID=183260 RepID=A0ABR2DPN4_9ROSI